jgi:hypothetical protein
VAEPRTEACPEECAAQTAPHQPEPVAAPMATVTRPTERPGSHSAVGAVGEAALCTAEAGKRRHERVEQ